MEISKAKRILGKNLIGPQELSGISNPFSPRLPEAVPEIPFSEKEIEEKHGSHILVLCPREFRDGTDITIATIRKKIALCGRNPRFYNQDWYLRESFIHVSLEEKWLLASKKLLDESRAMPVDKVVSAYKLNSAVELTFAFFANYFVNDGEKLWNNDYIWCSDTDNNGDQIYVGRYTDLSGLNADGFEIHRHLKIKNNYGVI